MRTDGRSRRGEKTRGAIRPSSAATWCASSRPGTITEETLLEARQSNYLAGLAEANGATALAWLEISTGEFSVTTVTPATIAAELARIDAREILLPEILASRNELQDWKAKMTVQPANIFDARRAERILKETYAVTSLEAVRHFHAGRACRLRRAARLRETHAKKPRFVFDAPRRQLAAEHMLIDAASARNLEIMYTLSGEKKGSLFSVIDETVTASGARLLASWLATPLTDVKKIAARLDNVQCFAEAASLRAHVREYLKACPDAERALSRLGLNRGGPRDLLSIAASLKAAQEIPVQLERQETPELPDGLISLRDALGGS